jgi:hypothetical protein
MSTSSLGIRPLLAPLPFDHQRVHSLGPRPDSGRRCHPSTSCSVLVVSHHLDGFLRAAACGFVAPRCRPWGSPRFLPRPPELREPGRHRHSPRRGSYPSKSFPRQQPRRITATVALLWVLRNLRTTRWPRPARLPAGHRSGPRRGSDRAHPFGLPRAAEWTPRGRGRVGEASGVGLPVRRGGPEVRPHRVAPGHVTPPATPVAECHSQHRPFGAADFKALLH